MNEVHKKFERQKKEAAAKKRNTEEKDLVLQTKLNESKAREKSWSSEEASLKEKCARLEVSRIFV